MNSTSQTKIRTALIIGTLTAIVVPPNHAQVTNEPRFNVDIYFADDARIVGSTSSFTRSVLWSFDRSTAESKTLYATPNFFSNFVEPVEDNGVILLKEDHIPGFAFRNTNHIVVDMRDGKEPTLKILPASIGETVTAIGVHEKSNSLVLHRRSENSVIEDFLHDTFSVDFETETFELLNLETWEIEILDLPLIVHPKRSYIHEDLLYFNGVPSDAYAYARHIYTYDLVKKEPPTIFANNTTMLDARFASGYVEILLEKLTVARVVDGKLYRQRSHHRAINHRRTLGSHLYLNGMLSYDPTVYFTEEAGITTVAQNPSDIHANEEELFITYPDSSQITLQKNRKESQLDIPHAHFDYVQTIPFNNVAPKTSSLSILLKIVLPLALLTPIVFNLLRRKRARRGEEQT